MPFSGQTVGVQTHSAAPALPLHCWFVGHATAAPYSQQPLAASSQVAIPSAVHSVSPAPQLSTQAAAQEAAPAGPVQTSGEAQVEVDASNMQPLESVAQVTRLPTGSQVGPSSPQTVGRQSQAAAPAAPVQPWFVGHAVAAPKDQQPFEPSVHGTRPSGTHSVCPALHPSLHSGAHTASNKAPT